MSGSIDYTQLFPSAGSSVSNTILDSIYGISSGGGDPNALQSLQTAETNQTTDIANTAKQPSVQRDIAAFQTAVNSATSTSELLQTPAFLKVFLTANNLGGQIGYPALAKQTLLSDPTDTSSLANTLTDSNWKNTTTTYNFFAHGLSAVRNSTALATLSSSYAEVIWRQSLEATTPGLSDALTFRQEASTITSVDQILGDPILRNVVTTALNIPQQIAFQDLGAQEQAISSQVDITRFQDPHFVESFTQQFLLNAQTNAANTQTSNSLDALAIQAAGLTV
jgi:hypothetical protein